MDQLNGYVSEVDGVNESPGGLVVRIDSGRQLQPSNLAQPAAISMPGLESGRVSAAAETQEIRHHSAD